MSRIESIRARAEMILAEAWGTHVRLGDVETMTLDGARSLLLRVAVTNSPVDTPESVVVKCSRHTGYDSDSPRSAAATALFRDWAGLQFLASFGEKPALSPRFYGGDRELGFIIVEDLGPSKNLDRILSTGSSTHAEHALVSLAETLGQMHARTAGCEEQYQRIRDALSPGDVGSLELANHLKTYGPELVRQCQELGVVIPEGCLADVEAVAATMADPGPFRAYTQGDSCPDNFLLDHGRACLIDFEFGGFRHALLDGVFGFMRFPTCIGSRDIPEQVLDAMESAYRQELAGGCPEACDDRLYFRAVADAGAFWALENLAQLLPAALAYEQPHGLATNRQRLLTRLAAFVRLADRAKHLPNFCQLVSRLTDELHRRWNSQMPLYDAFHQKWDVPAETAAGFIAVVQAGNVAEIRQMLGLSPGLVNAKASDPDECPVLYLAVATKNSECVRLLLEAGADWRITTRSGWTVLARACAESTPEVVSILLENGANLNVRDCWGSLPIYGAINDPAMLAYLLSRQAHIDIKVAIGLDRLDLVAQLLAEDPASARLCFGTGMTILHDVVRAGDSRREALGLLLRYGANVNARTNWQATPLHIAALNGQEWTLEFLLANGADPSARDDRGRTPLALALANQKSGSAAVLQNCGAPL